MFFLIKQLPPKSTPKVLRVAYTTRFRSPQSSAQKALAPKAQAPKAPVPKAPAPKASAPKASAPKASATKPQAVKAPAAKAQPVRPEPAEAPAPQVEKAEPAAAKPARREKPEFAIDDYVVYPTPGVGRVTAIEERTIAGAKLTLFVISFERERMTPQTDKGGVGK